MTDPTKEIDQKAVEVVPDGRNPFPSGPVTEALLAYFKSEMRSEFHPLFASQRAAHAAHMQKLDTIIELLKDIAMGLA